MVSPKLESREQQTLPSLIITRVREQARGIRSFDLMPESVGAKHGVAFVPGQVAVLAVPGAAPAYFAFASAPEDLRLRRLRLRLINNQGRGFITLTWKCARILSAVFFAA